MDVKSVTSLNKTYVYLWTYMQFKQEQAEWDCVNKLLQNHGFKPVLLADPVENKNLSDLVLLDKRSAADIRAMLRTMIADSDRRQTLIQELVQANGQLRGESQEQMSQAARHSRRVTEVEGLLEALKGQVQDLEDRYLGKAAQQHSQVHQLQQEKQAAQSHSQALEMKLSQERNACGELHKKLCFTVREEEQRLARQSHAFEQIHKRSACHDSPADQQVLDVIDFYETQATELRGEIRFLKEDPEPSRGSDSSSSEKVYGEQLPSSSSEAALKAQLDESEDQREELKREVQRLEQELETRPTVKDLKTYKHQLRLMERWIKHNTRLPNGDSQTDVSSADAANSGGVPAQGTCAQYQQLLNDLGAVLTGPRAPVSILRQRPALGGSEQFSALLPTLETWARQLAMLTDLEIALTKLTKRLMPWRPLDDGHISTETVTVEDLLLLVDTLLEDTSIDEEKVLRSPTRYTLESMVSHFQKLFDVDSLRGVYPRMNELYTKLGQMTNTMTNLRDVLDLDDKAPPSEVVNRVASIVSSAEDQKGMKLHNLLAEGDIDSIIIKVKEHEEFFPAFHSLVTELMRTLGVANLDDVLPALMSLKLESH